MNETRPHFALTCKDSTDLAPVLVGVQAQGRLDGVLFELCLRQTYRNTSHQVLEVVYTFPLPPMAVLLGFASELDGLRQEGVVVAKREAERQYEAALQGGDAPVMLEAHGNGLHTANIGNLKPGEALVLECRFAQLLSFEQGRLRVSVPSTIAPRYGSAEQAGLQPQQVPLTSLDAEYPLDLTLTLGEALASATAECPTHRFAVSRGPDGSMRMDLAPGALLDRDMVVIVTPSEPRPSLVVQADDTFGSSVPVVMMAALQPPLTAPRDRIALKLLVDCSGSMNGDSITSARTALRGVVAGLSENDHLSLSRFGSHIEHLFAPSQAKPQAIRHLRPLIDHIQADLGNTEMAGALNAVFALPLPAEHDTADVLLITDGAIWQAEATMEAARQSGHRVFAIGVGAAPAEGVLRALAESTGGACEFATPGEALEAAAQRMLKRMRQPVLAKVRVEWGSPPAWACGPASSVFGGDTVLAFAGFAGPIPANQVRLLAEDAQGRTVELARGEAAAPAPGDSLPRMAAAQRIAYDGAVDALGLALRYQLISKQTNCVLVHHRADADKAMAQATLMRVRSMHAAGSGGLGTAYHMHHSSLASPSVWRESRASAEAEARWRNRAPATKVGRPESETSESIIVPDFLRRPFKAPAPATLAELARTVGDHIDQTGGLRGLAERCARLYLYPDAQQALDEAANAGLSLDQAWLLLAHWVNHRDGELTDVGLKASLQSMVDAVDRALATTAIQIFQRHLAKYKNAA